jgi:ABC-type multidrug transport system ATPase subunit
MVSSRTMSDCLSMRGVWKSYDAGVRGCSATVSVLRDIHLDVAAGEMVGIAAAPSAGKTTLLMCAGGVLRPDRGLVSWFGAPASRDHPARPDGIAFAGDRPFAYGFLTIREAVEYAAIVRDLPLRDSATRVADALDRTGLAAVAHRRVDAIDGRALARLAVATALLARPRLVLIDDFAPGCDADTAGELLALLRLVAREGAGVVVAGRFASRIPVALADATPVPTRLYALASGRLEPSADRADVAVRRSIVPVPHAHTRVAEVSRPSAARDNGAR